MVNLKFKFMNYFLITIIFFILTVAFMISFKKVSLSKEFVNKLNYHLYLKTLKLLNEKKILDDFEITGRLRNFVYKNSIWDEDAFRSEGNETYKLKKPIDIYLYYKNNLKGGRCDNISYFYQQILNEFGYKNYTYHFGNLNHYNHVLNLIEVKIKNKKKIIVQYATYNLTFLDQQNNPLDFFDLIQLIKKRNFNKIMVSSDNSKRKVLVSQKNKIINQKSPDNYEPLSNLDKMLEPRLVGQDENNLIYSKIINIVNN